MICTIYNSITLSEKAMTIFYITDPSKIKENTDAFDRIDIIYAYGNTINSNVTYLDAWLADRKISRNYWLWPDKSMEVRFEVDKSYDETVLPRDFTLKLMDTFIGDFSQGITREARKSSLVFEPGNVDTGMGRVNDEHYLSQHSSNMDAVSHDEIELKIRSKLNNLPSLKSTETDDPSNKNEKLFDYSIQLHRVHRLIQKEEFERKGTFGKMVAKIGEKWEEITGSKSTWKLPSSAQKINKIIDDFLTKAQKRNTQGKRQHTLSEEQFNKLKNKIVSAIGTKHQPQTPGFFSTERDKRTSDLYSKILKELDAESSTQKTPSAPEATPEHRQYK